MNNYFLRDAIVTCYSLICRLYIIYLSFRYDTDTKYMYQLVRFSSRLDSRLNCRLSRSSLSQYHAYWVSGCLYWERERELGRVVNSLSTFTSIIIFLWFLSASCISTNFIVFLFMNLFIVPSKSIWFSLKKWRNMNVSVNNNFLVVFASFAYKTDWSHIQSCTLWKYVSTLFYYRMLW